MDIQTADQQKEKKIYNAKLATCDCSWAELSAGCGREKVSYGIIKSFKNGKRRNENEHGSKVGTQALSY